MVQESNLAELDALKEFRWALFYGTRERGERLEGRGSKFFVGTPPFHSNFVIPIT